MSMVGKKYQTTATMTLVLVTGEYQGHGPDDHSGIYFRYVDEQGNATGPTLFMRQGAVPIRLEGPICDCCQIVKSVPGMERCAVCLIEGRKRAPES